MLQRQKKFPRKFSGQTDRAVKLLRKVRTGYPTLVDITRLIPLQAPRPNEILFSFGILCDFYCGNCLKPHEQILLWKSLFPFSSLFSSSVAFTDNVRVCSPSFRPRMNLMHYVPLNNETRQWKWTWETNNDAFSLVSDAARFKENCDFPTVTQPSEIDKRVNMSEDRIE